MTSYQQMPDGSWAPAVPIGWQEEHSKFSRFIFWLRGIEHCNDDEGRYWRHCDSCGKRLTRKQKKERAKVCHPNCQYKKYVN